MKEVWITTSKAAELLHVSERTVQYKVNNFRYRYIDGRGRGGKKLEILLSSLPEEAQARYAGLEPLPPGQELLEACYGKQREAADFKMLIVRDYQKSGLSPEDFVQKFNSDNPPEEAISVSKLFRWQRKAKEGGAAALLDRRGGYNKGLSSIPKEAWEYFYSLYMTQQKRGIQICYDYTKKAFPQIPGVGAFRRKIKQIPKQALLLYRDGEDAFRNATPCAIRDKTDIHSNDIWYSDHHHIDVFVRSSEGQGKICRLWLTVFFDARSNKVISYICREADPNATVVKQCLKMGIEAHGIPNELYFDNGKDYRSKSFSKDFPLSIYRQLGIGQIYATPYLGRAKTVERFFRTFEERFGKMFPTYTGKDAKNRPEQMHIPNEKIYALAESQKVFLKCLNNYMEDYNHTVSRGSDLEGKSPEEVYYRNLTVKKEVTDRRALAILCGSFESRTVNKNGITFERRIYENSALNFYYGKKVLINYEPDNIDILNVFDEDMNAVCTATAKTRTPFRHTTEADYQKAKKDRRRARKMVEQYRPHAEQDLISMIAQNQLSEKMREEETNRPAAVEPVQLEINTAAFTETRPSKDDDAADMPDLQSVLLRKYEEEQKRRIGGY